jgi:hypothetical protein
MSSARGRRSIFVGAEIRSRQFRRTGRALMEAVMFSRKHLPILAGMAFAFGVALVPASAGETPQCMQVAESGCPSGYPVDCGDWCCESGYSCCGPSIQCCGNCIGWPGSTPRYLCCGSSQFGCVDANDNIWCCDNGKACGSYGQCD